jgi:hypothetical protein
MLEVWNTEAAMANPWLDKPGKKKENKLYVFVT